MFLPTCLSDRSMRVETKSGCTDSIISRTSNKSFHRRVNIEEEAHSFLLSSFLSLRLSFAVQVSLSCTPLPFSLAVQRRPLLYSSSILFGCTKKASCTPLRFSLAVQRRPLLYSSLLLFVCTEKTSPIRLFSSFWVYKEDLSCTPL